MFQQNITNLTSLQQSALCRHLGRIDSISWTRAEILKHEYLALGQELKERAKRGAMRNQSALRNQTALRNQSALTTGDPTIRNLTPPQFLSKPTAFPPVSALVVFGD